VFVGTHGTVGADAGHQKKLHEAGQNQAKEHMGEFLGDHG
jgi:hypothetical protein